jgi:hypothetical protein
MAWLEVHPGGVVSDHDGRAVLPVVPLNVTYPRRRPGSSRRNRPGGRAPNPCVGLTAQKGGGPSGEEPPLSVRWMGPAVAYRQVSVGWQFGPHDVVPEFHELIWVPVPPTFFVPFTCRPALTAVDVKPGWQTLQAKPWVVTWNACAFGEPWIGFPVDGGSPWHEVQDIPAVLAQTGAAAVAPPVKFPWQ